MPPSHRPLTHRRAWFAALAVLALCAQMAAFHAGMRHHARMAGAWADSVCRSGGAAASAGSAVGRDGSPTEESGGGSAWLQSCCLASCVAGVALPPAAVAWTDLSPTGRDAPAAPLGQLVARKPFTASARDPPPAAA